jgi:WD40 repeat protein
MFRSRFPLSCLVLAFALPTRAAAPARPHLDYLGDPLPPSAVARLGTARLRHHDRPISGIAFAPNSGLFASASPGSIHLWDSSTGKRLRTLSPLPGDTLDRGLSFSPDGALLSAVLWEDGNSRWSCGIWQVASGRWVRAVARQQEPILATAFAEGTRTLVTFGAWGTVSWWRVGSGKRVRQLSLDFPREGPVSVGMLLPTFSPDGKSVAAVPLWEGATSRGWWSISVWDLASGKESWRFEQKPGFPCAPVWSPDSRRLAFNWSTTGPTVCDSAGKVIRRLSIPDEKDAPREGDKGQICKLAFSPDGNTLAVATRGFGVRLWDLPVDLSSVELAFSRTTSWLPGGDRRGRGRPASFTLPTPGEKRSGDLSFPTRGESGERPPWRSPRQEISGRLPR